MSKFIGLICAWGNEAWIELAIIQALDFCDEVIVSVGAHSEEVKKYEDRTLEICQKYKGRIKLVDVAYTGKHNSTKAQTMNKMLESSSLFEVGNSVILLDVDEFYHKSDIELVKQKLQEYNSVVIGSMIFFINMDRYIFGEHYRAWKITSKDCRFRPTNNWTGEMQPQWTSPPIMFHYTFLLNQYAKIDFWNSEFEYTKQNNKIRWMKEIYLKYDLNNEDYWLDKNLELFGVRRPSGPHDFGFPNQRLLTLDIKHPDIIENSSLRHIKDFRKLYENISS